MPENLLHLSLIQSDIIADDVQKNLNNYEKLIADSSFDRDLLVFPEMFNCGFSENVRQIAENENDRSMDFLRSTSIKYCCDVAASMPIIDDDKLFNRLFWIRNGEIISFYDKHNLFFGEEKHFSSGENKTVVKLKDFKILPLLCFDVRFPEWSRNRLIDNEFEYDCLIYATNFPARRVSELKALVRARAIENQAFVIVTNRIGNDGFNVKYAGGTFVVGIDGDIISEIPYNAEMVQNCILDKNALNIPRNEFPVSEFWE